MGKDKLNLKKGNLIARFNRHFDKHSVLIVDTIDYDKKEVNSTTIDLLEPSLINICKLVRYLDFEKISNTSAKKGDLYIIENENDYWFLTNEQKSDLGYYKHFHLLQNAIEDYTNEKQLQ